LQIEQSAYAQNSEELLLQHGQASHFVWLLVFAAQFVYVTSQTWREHRKVQNLFQWKCDPCKEADEAERSAEFDRRTRRNW
jgi:hypothetical protein